MDIADQLVQPFPRRLIAGFLSLFVVLYVLAAGIAEVTMARNGPHTAFQKLLTLQGQKVDWVVLGASHALPLAYGDVPGRLKADSGQSMVVLAEVGAGPLYNSFVFRQASQDIAPGRLLYVVDAFAFTSSSWNEVRISDRKLLRKTPLRFSTARNMAGIAVRHGTDPTGLADYLTSFSKLNPPDRFPQAGWRGAADFDRKARISRHAVQSRINYLYPELSPGENIARYLDILTTMFDTAQAAGIEVVVVKLPLPDAFRTAQPDEAAFDQALRDRLVPRGISFHDLSADLSDPGYFFDTDHLNRPGVEALYESHLREILTSGARL